MCKDFNACAYLLVIYHTLTYYLLVQCTVYIQLTCYHYSGIVGSNPRYLVLMSLCHDTIQSVT